MTHSRCLRLCTHGRHCCCSVPLIRALLLALNWHVATLHWQLGHCCVLAAGPLLCGVDTRCQEAPQVGQLGTADGISAGLCCFLCACAYGDGWQWEGGGVLVKGKLTNTAHYLSWVQVQLVPPAQLPSGPWQAACCTAVSPCCNLHAALVVAILQVWLTSNRGY